jgi:hypothetical protein
MNGTSPLELLNALSSFFPPPPPPLPSPPHFDVISYTPLSPPLPPPPPPPPFYDYIKSPSPRSPPPPPPAHVIIQPVMERLNESDNESSEDDDEEDEVKTYVPEIEREDLIKCIHLFTYDKIRYPCTDSDIIGETVLTLPTHTYTYLH